MARSVSGLLQTYSRAFLNHSRCNATVVRPRFSQVPPTSLMSDKPPSLVIFDKDGTLLCFHTMWIPWAVKTSKLIESACGLTLFNDIARVLGLCTVENKVKPGLLAEGTLGQITTEICDILVENGVGAAKAREIVLASMRNSNETAKTKMMVKEIANTYALFNRLKQHGAKIAICTADNRASSLMALNLMNVSHLVDMVMCGDDPTSLPKPHPHNALTICRELEVDPSDTIMVGDTRVDIEMAHAAHLRAGVGVLSGVGCRNHLNKADILIKNVEDLIPTFYETK